MEAKKQIYLSLLSIKYNIIREIVDRRAFILSIFLSILNNAVFIVQWIILFNLRNEMGGYKFNDIMYIWAMACSTSGMAAVFFNGARRLPELIFMGKLDSYIVQPRNLYLNIATSSSDIFALGDVVYGTILCLIFLRSFLSFILFIIFTITGSIIMLAFHMTVGSLAFWIKNGRLVSLLLGNIMMTVSTYPDGIFNKAIKVLLYSVFPMGFIVYIPVKALRDPTLPLVLLVFIAMLFFLLMSIFVFYIGKKHYSSANRMFGKY